MCGIAGLVTTRDDPDALDDLRKALARMTHRGPDDEGTLTFPHPPRSGPLVALGNRRLRIIDLSEAGHQPMSSADGRFSLVFNGEIYNYRELKAELLREGHRFQSQSDTEVLLHAFVAWGQGALARLEGMFAIALLDRLERRLLLVRDEFGIKPLFYAQTSERLVFASEIGALLEFRGISRRAHPGRVFDYLNGGNSDHGADTLLAGVQQVPPAHLINISLDHPGPAEPERYWAPDVGERRELSFQAAADELRSLFLDSVRLHLRSDVPVGFALSGGLDSSAVLLAARRVLGLDAELHTFSFVPEDPSISEEQYQTVAASSAGAVSHQLRFDPADLARDFEHLVDIQGGPFASPTIYAQHRIFSLARESGIRVMLGGQGADELFAGYRRYVPARIASLVKQGSWLEALRFFRAAGASPGVDRRALALASIGYALPHKLHAAVRRRRRRVNRLDWISQEWFAGMGFAPEAPWRPRGREAMKDLLVHTIEQAHLQALMRYEDRNAMAFSIENRVPFLTPRLARFALSLPERFLISPEGEHKAVLRRAMSGLVPEEILTRRDKVGFAVPVVAWLGDLRPWVNATLARAADYPPLVPERLRAHWATALLRRDLTAAFSVWRAIGFLTWADRFAVRFD